MPTGMTRPSLFTAADSISTGGKRARDASKVRYLRLTVVRDLGCVFNDQLRVSVDQSDLELQRHLEAIIYEGQPPPLIHGLFRLPRRFYLRWYLATDDEGASKGR